ncbi:phosphatidate cytidylyltransferase, partial [Candidatus Omnitrophota bacterium]
FFPSVSPKKTLEGFIGGIVGVLMLSVIAGFYTDTSYRFHTIALSLLIALAGQAGDLSESLIKRDLGVKDSSNIIPGHGGVLDRFDSLFFAAPVVYSYILIVFRVSGGHS